MISEVCPLCLSSQKFTRLEHQAWPQRSFLLCSNCDLVFVSQKDQVTNEKEKARYETHQNLDSQVGYIKFLQPTLDWIQSSLAPGSRVLDYGSGPEPVLSQKLIQAGYDCFSYDVYFQPILPSGKFDLILLHEVFEHFRNPEQELQKIKSLLLQNASLLIRIETRPNTSEEFFRWWYPRDFTHVIFPSEKTWKWLEQKYQFEHIRLSHHLQLFKNLN